MLRLTPGPARRRGLAYVELWTAWVLVFLVLSNVVGAIARGEKLST
jgi:hypothetical protein